MTKHKKNEKHHTHSEHKKHVTRKTDTLVIWKSLTVIFAILTVIGFYNAFVSKGPAVSHACSSSDVQKVMDFINEKLVKPGTLASLENCTAENVLWIETEYQNQKIPVVVKDGKYLMLPNNVIDIEQEKAKEEEEKEKVENMPKAERPKIDLFIMSFCPYGRAAAENTEKLYQMLKDKADFEVHYIVYPKSFYESRGADTSKYCVGEFCSMHGVKETEEDIREICIAKEYGWDKYWEYMKVQLSNCSLSNIDTCWKESAQQVGIDVQKIEDCVQQNGQKYLEEEYNLTTKYGISGSPTLVINNEFKQTGLVPIDKYQQMICNAFTQEPPECSEKVESESATPEGSCG